MESFSKIKVLYTIPNFDTAGSGKALLKIAERLDNRVFTPEILCMHEKGEYFNTVKSSGIKTHVFPYTTNMIPRFKGIRKAYSISRRLKAINPDLIHSFHYAPDYSEPLAAKLAGIPWIYTKKNMNWGGNSRNGWKLRTYLASKIVIQNTDMGEMFFRNKKNVSLISRGVDTNDYFPREKDKALMDELGIYKTNVILTVANLVPVKGIEVLIQAFKKLNTKNSCLLIVGDNSSDYALKLEKLCLDLGLDGKVIFTGKRLDIHRFYSIADLFVLPTLNQGRKEGSPVALLEAMASGVMSLGSCIPGIKDQLKELPDQIVPSGDIQFLSNKIDEYLQFNRSEKASIINEQLRMIKNKYLIEKEVNLHERLYKEIVNL